MHSSEKWQWESWGDSICVKGCQKESAWPHLSSHIYILYFWKSIILGRKSQNISAMKQSQNQNSTDSTWRLVGSNTCHKKNHFHFDMFSVLVQYLFWKYSWLVLHVILRNPKRIEKKILILNGVWKEISTSLLIQQNSQTGSDIWGHIFTQLLLAPIWTEGSKAFW